MDKPIVRRLVASYDSDESDVEVARKVDVDSFPPSPLLVQDSPRPPSMSAIPSSGSPLPSPFLLNASSKDSSMVASSLEPVLPSSGVVIRTTKADSTDSPPSVFASPPVAQVVDGLLSHSPVVLNYDAVDTVDGHDPSLGVLTSTPLPVIKKKKKLLNAQNMTTSQSSSHADILSFGHLSSVRGAADSISGVFGFDTPARFVRSDECVVGSSHSSLAVGVARASIAEEAEEDMHVK